jgi:hypothetical protein
MRLYILVLPLMCLSAGCGISYSVSVNGYSATGQGLHISKGASIAVVTDSNVPNPILKKEVGEKVEKLLAEKGYRLTQDNPDYYLLFDYGIDAGRTVTDITPIHRPILYDPYPYTGFYPHGYTTYVAQSEIVHTRWLILKLIKGKAYDASKKTEPVWIGEITSAGTSSDLRELLNYMLVVAFEHFVEDTKRQLTTAISRDDERVLSLTGP